MSHGTRVVFLLRKRATFGRVVAVRGNSVTLTYTTLGGLTETRTVKLSEIAS